MVDAAEKARELADRPYTTVIVWSHEDQTYLAMHPELDGCMTDGETPDEAKRMLDDARLGWISVALENGLDVPEPLRITDGRLIIDFRTMEISYAR